MIEKREASSGFTLAEVLITLGIIGVVAAMTMPTLINQTRGAQYKTAFKKALSAISQAVTLNVALDDWSFADIDTADTDTDDMSMENMLTSRMNVVKTTATTTPYGDTADAYVESSDSDSSVPTTIDRWVYFNDGIMFAYTSSDTSCKESAPCYGYVDVNGDKGPNKFVTCDNGKFTAGSEATTCGDNDEDCTPSAATEATCSAVSNPTDLYLVKYYDQTILPATAAGKAVLYGK